jgi:hypothetical protein
MLTDEHKQKRKKTDWLNQLATNFYDEREHQACATSGQMFEL